MSGLLRLVRAHKILTGALVLGVLGGLYISTRPPAPPSFDTAKVVRGDVIQDVSVTGRVESEQEVELAFERGGRVATEPKAVGARVEKGATLVRLDSSELSASRAQAKANLDYELVRLEEIKKGSRAEDIAIFESKVKSAENTLSDARLGLSDKLKLAIDALDDAVFAKTDALFENPRTGSPKFIVPIPDAATIAKLESQRLAVGAGLKKRESGDMTLLASVLLEKGNLSLVRAYLDTLLVALSTMPPTSIYSGNTIDGWKVAVNAARTSVSSAQTVLLSAEEKFGSADRSLEIAQSELELKKAPATPESMAAQEARIAAVRATISSFDAQITKMTLVAPFAGVITMQHAKIGATVAPNTPLVTLQSDSVFTITANVPEADFAKLSVGDSADVTLDAYGMETHFPAKVGTIDPAETIIEGVPTYKVTFYFNANDARIRSGLTANIDILTEKREGVLKLPARAVQTKDGKKFVRVPDANGTISEVEITVGLRGSDGTIEIVSGLTEGQEAITFEGK